jgi:hypothetical protein
MLLLEVMPGTFGRPSTIPLFVAAEIASAAGARIELADTPTAQGVRAMVTFSR